MKRKKVKDECCRRYRKKSEACKRCPLLHALSKKKAKKTKSKKKLRRKLDELAKQMTC